MSPRLLLASGAWLLLTAAVASPGAGDYASDAKALAPLIAANYAYLDDLPGHAVPSSAELDAQRDAVHDDQTLLHYAEDMLAALADHHASTARSFKDDWALVPSYSDLWIERVGNAYRIDAVRADSPAAKAGIHAGDGLVAVDGLAINDAVTAYWARLGLPAAGERQSFAARVIAAGRRDRVRVLKVAKGSATRTLTLPSLYADQPQRPPVTVRGYELHINNSLGDQSTVAAFDRAMTAIPIGAAVTIDLTDTPSGGNTSVARAIMAWFVREPMAYQMHNLPAEERETGIARQWVEQVLPRSGKYHHGPVTIRVGRWTGSMAEGMAAGFATIGAEVCGTRMARLKGAVYDFDLPKTGMRVRFPAERLYTVAGLPRERMVPMPCRAVARRGSSKIH